VGTSTARKAPQCIAAVQAARPCSSPRADSQFAGTRASGNRNSTPAMNSNAFHFAANPPVACRGPGRCPGAAGSWLGVSIMVASDDYTRSLPSRNIPRPTGGRRRHRGARPGPTTPWTSPRAAVGAVPRERHTARHRRREQYAHRRGAAIAAPGPRHRSWQLLAMRFLSHSRWTAPLGRFRGEQVRENRYVGVGLVGRRRSLGRLRNGDKPLSGCLRWASVEHRGHLRRPRRRANADLVRCISLFACHNVMSDIY
jgi:hypothetical protein